MIARIATAGCTSRPSRSDGEQSLRRLVIHSHSQTKEMKGPLQACGDVSLLRRGLEGRGLLQGEVRLTRSDVSRVEAQWNWPFLQLTRYGEMGGARSLVPREKRQGRHVHSTTVSRRRKVIPSTAVLGAPSLARHSQQRQRYEKGESQTRIGRMSSAGRGAPTPHPPWQTRENR